MFVIEVFQPAIWCLVPLRSSNLPAGLETVRDWETWHLDPPRDWRSIGAAASAAVLQAQHDLQDPFAARVNVSLHMDLGLNDIDVVQNWLSADGPEWAPESGDISNGRHRTFSVRAAGGSLAPVIQSSAGDAARCWLDDDGTYAAASRETVSFWHEDRDWWNTDEAIEWRSLNESHLRLWDLMIDRWSRRLGAH